MQSLSDFLPGLVLKDKLYFMGGGYTLPGNDSGLISRMEDEVIQEISPSHANNPPNRAVLVLARSQK